MNDFAQNASHMWKLHRIVNSYINSQHRQSANCCGSKFEGITIHGKAMNNPFQLWSRLWAPNCLTEPTCRIPTGMGTHWIPTWRRLMTRGVAPQNWSRWRFHGFTAWSDRNWPMFIMQFYNMPLRSPSHPIWMYQINISILPPYIWVTLKMVPPPVLSWFIPPLTIDISTISPSELELG